jgi:hypothetical protein
VRPYRRDVQLKSLYGITLADFDRLLAEQNGQCATCGATTPGKRGVWRVDHDHLTGQVRGLLCEGCNRGIGCLQDDPVIFMAAARYVAAHREIEAGSCHPAGIAAVAWRRMAVKPGWARKRDRLQRRESDAARAAAAGPRWMLSAAEWRLLVITFVGGLGSIVAGACVVGGAIAIARRLGTEDLAGWAQVTVLAAFLGIVGVTLAREIRRRADISDRARLVFSVAIWATLAVWSVLTAMVLMVWIGVAAGVK